DGKMRRLTLSGEILNVWLDAGRTYFTVSSDSEGTLTLTPAEQSRTWVLAGDALSTLNRSGVERICLTMDDGEVYGLSTDIALSGRLYDRLRSKGCVRKDFLYNVSADGLTVEVAGVTYLLNENGELEEKAG
ncbi:MAG: hypothetical protein IKE30_03455, partial [Clostridia bacterium]|nr:hypothetical protein [Clostridia bacterium]